jgi:hypothetical protein
LGHGEEEEENNKEKVERDKSATEGDITPCTSEILKLITQARFYSLRSKI